MTSTASYTHSSPEPAFIPERVPAPEVEASALEMTEDFETLRDRGRDLVAKGSYREAAAVYRQAAQVAAAAGEADLADEALCGWGAAETELGNGVEVMPELRQILLSSPVDHNCCLAAYTLARALERDGQVKKALFYARLFRDRAAYVPRDGLVGIAHNLLGNLLVAQGSEANAILEYQTALRRSEKAPPFWTALAEGNLGYCLVVGATATGRQQHSRLREGLRLIYRSLRTFRREGAEEDVALCHQDLCFAHLELRRFASAARHGERALELAERYETLESVKNCLYLLGQTALLDGKTNRARRLFGELERRFYPNRTGLADLLMSVDLCRVVNLRAS